LFVSEILSAVIIGEIVEVLLSGEVDLTGRTLVMELVEFSCGVCGLVWFKVRSVFRVN
jgi:hypothetical protein